MTSSIHFRRIALAVFTLSLAGLAHAASFVVPDDRELVRRSDAIVIATAELSYGQFTREGGIETVTKFSIEDVIKGSTPAVSLDVFEPGGVVGNIAQIIPGSPRFEAGQRVLLFLKQTGPGRFSATDLVLGKFTFTKDTAGQPILMRDAAEITGWDPDLKVHREHARSEEKFLDFVRAAAARRPAAQDYFLEQSVPQPQPVRTNRSFTAISNATFTATSYTLEIGNGLGARWNVFPNAVTFYTGATQEPGAPGGGVTAAQAALNAWNSDPNSNVNYVYGGTDTTHTQGLHVADGRNTILFERDLSSWGVSPFTCSSNSYSGTLGLGGVTQAQGTHTLNNETFNTTKEGDVEMNRGIANCTLLFNNGDFNSAVAHEVGHTLGFRHSDETRDSNSPCTNDPSLECSNQAIMKSFVAQGLNANLQPWDQHAVAAVYPNTSTTPPPPPPPTCTAPAITQQPTSRTITQGQSTTLSVTATGTGPLVYQWYVGNSPNTTTTINNGTGPTVTVNPTKTTNYWVRVGNSCGIVNSVTITVTVNPPATVRRVRGDFNGDNVPDLLWRNYSTGANRIWLMSTSGAILSTVTLPSEFDVNWNIVGAGDFNGDGMQDIVWRNYSNGQNVVWYMNNTTKAGAANLDTVTDVRWRIESVNDFNRDGQADLLWRHYGTGQNAIWLMNGVGTMAVAYPPAVTNTNYHIGGTGDTNGDGVPDIVWRNTATGEVAIWYMAGPDSSTIASTRSLLSVTDQNWHLEAVASFNGDAYADLIWRHYTDGQDAIWYLSGGQLGSTASLASEPNLSWRIQGPR